MARGRRVYDNVFLVGGPGLSDDADCCVYLADFGKDLVLIDAGAGPSAATLGHNIMELGYNPMDITLAVATHAHIDHVGGLPYLREEFGVRLAAHGEDADSLALADDAKTAASWYGIVLPPIAVDERLTGESGSWTFPGGTLHWVHTPGHTPGSISPYLDTAGKRVLFGQDIHGPFSEAFGSNLVHYRASMEKLLALDADILCEGHFGIYEGKKKVRQYIESYLKRNVG